MRCFIYSINYYAKNVHIDFVEIIEKITVESTPKDYDIIDCIILASAELSYVHEEHQLSFYEEEHPDKYSRRRRLGVHFATFGLEQELINPRRISWETCMTTDRNFLEKITVLKSRLDTYKLQNFIDKCLIMEL